MSNIVQFKPCANLAVALRNIADQIESGEMACEEMTIICPPDVFHLGVIDDGQAAEHAIFNMNYGIHKLMKAATDAEDRPEA